MTDAKIETESADLVAKRRLQRGRTKSYLKIGALGLLIVLLMIPLAMIDRLTSDRAGQRSKVVAEIGAAWGAPQRLVGPFLIVPYRKGASGGKAFLVILPEKLSVAATLAPEERNRGIYRTTVYSATTRLSGGFRLPNLTRLGLTASDLDWANAYLSLRLTDPRNMTVGITTFGSTALDFQPNSRMGIHGRGVHAQVDKARDAIVAGETIPFRLDLRFTGRRSFRVAPIGRTSDVKMISPWRHPSFGGRYLPNSRQVGENGFDARWQVSFLGQAFPRVWVRDAVQDRSGPRSGRVLREIDRSLIGVSLVTQVDFYQKTERATKYGIILIILVVAAIFIFEVVGKVRFHPIEYGFVGLTLVMFYLLLLSFAEVLGFATAFGLAAVMSVSTISAYCATVLRSWQRGLVLGAMVAVAYANSFILLQLENFALIAGATGLFGVLILVMFATRHIDWTTFSDRREEAPVRGG